jgi:hypothetical protein
VDFHVVVFAKGDEKEVEGQGVLGMEMPQGRKMHDTERGNQEIWTRDSALCWAYGWEVESDSANISSP